MAQADGENVAKLQKLYWFDEGYKDFLTVIKSTWLNNYIAIKNLYARMETHSNDNIIVRWPYHFAMLFSMGSVILFGSVITAVISLLHVAVMSFAVTIMVSSLQILCLIDWGYRKYHRIFMACPSCMQKYDLPYYICPKCGKLHTDLRPSVYGIWKRTCECKEELPTNFYNGRRHLKSVCPNPSCPSRKGRGEAAAFRESRPICITMIGGRSVGKTTFIGAFFNQLKDMKNKDGWDFDPAEGDNRDRINDCLKPFNGGECDQTQEKKPIDVRTFVMHPSMAVDRLLHIYDIAGEVFHTGMSESHSQHQMDYCHGFIFVIDPFSLPCVQRNMENQLSDKDKSMTGKNNLNEIVNTFLGTLRNITGLKDTDLCRIPMAVVISKLDLGNIESKIGRKPSRRLSNRFPKILPNGYEAQDFLCRKLLKENGMTNFLNLIQNNFPNNRFFAYTAFGCNHKQGEEAQTEGIKQPMAWLFHQADKDGIGMLWKDDLTFEEKPVSMRLGMEELERRLQAEGYS